MILNAQKYRDLVTREMVREQTRRRVARKRAKDKGVTPCNADVTQRNGSVTPSDTDTKKEERSANGSRPQYIRASELITQSSYVPKTSVEDWLKELEADKTYQGIDVRREYGKMLNWCKLRSKKPTQRRFVNWLNNAEKTLPQRDRITSATTHLRRASQPNPRSRTRAASHTKKPHDSRSNSNERISSRSGRLLWRKDVLV